MEKAPLVPEKPVTRNTTANTMDVLAAKQKCRRASLRKMRKIRQSLLIHLAEEGNELAKEILQYQDNPERQMRCLEAPLCHGCIMLRDRGRCGSCVGCTTLKNCVEDRRRCASWADICKPYCAGTSVSGASSVFTDSVDYMARIETIFEELEKTSEEQEELLEGILINEDMEKARADPIYGESRIRKDLEVEEYFRGRLRNLVTAHQENVARLADADAELDALGLENQDEVVQEAPEPPGLAVQQPGRPSSRVRDQFTLNRPEATTSEPIGAQQRYTGPGENNPALASSLPDL